MKTSPNLTNNYSQRFVRSPVYSYKTVDTSRIARMYIIIRKIILEEELVTVRIRCHGDSVTITGNSVAATIIIITIINTYYYQYYYSKCS